MILFDNSKYTIKSLILKEVNSLNLQIQMNYIYCKIIPISHFLILFCFLSLFNFRYYNYYFRKKYL